MTIPEDGEKKRWVLDALNWLENFVVHDEDFTGNRDYESRAIKFQNAVVRDGKYRVVFLGAFNVGKSSAINAFLGGSYLPMDIEECTSRLTYIQHGDALSLLLELETPASRHETESLERALADIEIEVSSPGPTRIVIHCDKQEPETMRRLLTPLVTVAADEEYPHLASLREKIEALTLFLPSDALEKDIVFIDTPGVHSMSETRQMITYNVLEHCHLVIVFVDSGLVGNIHDLNFIKRIITCRGRRVFFVLNKADKLENHEIDPRGAYGPAAQLLETFKRHGIAENADIFFLSGYRALKAQELDQNWINFDETLQDNKLLIPTTVMARILNSINPPKDLSAYLMGQSRFPHLKERLLDYLLNENKINAVFRLADQFVSERSRDYLISLNNALALARDPAKFDELRANREALSIRIQEIRQASEDILRQYRFRCNGDDSDTAENAGYVQSMHAMLNEEEIENQVVTPLLDWLRTDKHLKESIQKKFQPLSAQLEHQVDEYISSVRDRLHTIMEQNESTASEAMARHIGYARELRARITEPHSVFQTAVSSSVSSEYAAFGAGGAVVGAMTGAVVGSVAPVIGTAIGAGIGGMIGAVIGFLARLAWSEERWIKKLTPVIRQNACLRLLGNTEDENARPVSAVIAEYLEQRAVIFEQALQGELENALNNIQQECDTLLSREEEIRREQETIIARLESKTAYLTAMRDKTEILLAASSAS